MVACYTESYGDVALNKGYSACGPTNDSATAVPCCSNGDICLSNSLCAYTHSLQGGSGYYAAGCTDASFGSPQCAKICSARMTGDVVYNATANIWNCCDDNHKIDCQNPSNVTFNAPPTGSLATIMTIPSTGTVWPTSQASSTATATPSANPDTGSTTSGSTLSAGAAAGIGVGVGLAVIFAVFFLWCFCRRRRQATDSYTSRMDGFEGKLSTRSNTLRTASSIGYDPYTGAPLREQDGFHPPPLPSTANSYSPTPIGHQGFLDINRPPAPMGQYVSFVSPEETTTQNNGMSSGHMGSWVSERGPQRGPAELDSNTRSELSNSTEIPVQRQTSNLK